MSVRYSFKTTAGTFRIVERAGEFHAFIEDEYLGNYPIPEQAADDLAGGHTSTPSSGIDTSTLGIPADLSEWDCVRR